jgi:hypothetical protein
MKPLNKEIKELKKEIKNIGEVDVEDLCLTRKAHLQLLRNNLEDVKKFFEDIVIKRQKIFQKDFDRYNKETIKYSNDKEQVEYSENKAIESMNILDELDELRKEFLGDEEE